MVLKVGSCSWQLAVGSGQWAVGSWQLAVFSWQFSFGSCQLAVRIFKITDKSFLGPSEISVFSLKNNLECFNWKK